MSQASAVVSNGQVFGNYIVVDGERTLRSLDQGRPGGFRTHPASLVRCRCGVERIVRNAALLAGKSRSCGAGLCSGVIGEGCGSYKHGQRNRPGYGVWSKMITRCEDPACTDYPDYGGRGITVCDRWRQSPKAFLDDMGPRPLGAKIDRIDVNGNYEPDNCRWADDVTQARNRRNSHYVEIDGVRMHLIDACKLTGISHSTARMRINRGWTTQKAATHPLRRW